MKIIKKTQVKQILTETSKESLRKKFNKRKTQLDLESEQLIFEKKKLQNKPGISKQDVHLRFKDEIEKRQEEMELLHFKVEQLELLEIGAELVEGEVESIIDVQVGDDWEELMKSQTIVIKDNKVLRIDD